MTNPDLGYFGGSSCFMVHANQKGFSKGTLYNKAGLHGCSLGEFRLEDVTVPTENRIGDEGIGSSIFATSMLWERLGLTALHLGWCVQLQETLIEHFRIERKEHPKQDHQVLKHQFVRYSGLNEAFFSQLMQLSLELDAPNKSTNGKVGRFKVLVSEHLQNFAQLGCEIIATFNHENYWIEQLFLDAAATKIYSGSSEIQLNLGAGDFRI
jgi:alkylation response protein AidB-like acyl-CoA dehydrogenase